MRKLMLVLAVTLGLFAIPATASALKFESAPGTPLVPGPSNLDPSPTMPPGFAPVDIATGDFNKDGFDDIAVITDYVFVQGEEGPEASPLSKGIYLYLGSANGSLQPSTSNPIGSNSPDGYGRFFIRAIDVDDDGDLDLVTGMGAVPTKIETYENTLTGNNEAFSTTPDAVLELDGGETAAGFRSVSTGDKDGDGDTDMVLGLYGNRYVFIRNQAESDGLLTLTGSVEVPRESPQDFDGIISTTIGNFGDNAVADTPGDLVMVSEPQYSADDSQPERLLYAKSTGNSSFAAPVELLQAGTNEYLGWVKRANLNGDQYDDVVFKQQLATGEDVIRTALGGPNGPTIQTGAGSSLEVYGAQAGAPADFNDDGELDLAIPQFVDAGFEVAIGDGSGKLELDDSGPFALPPIGSTEFYPQASEALDVNGDGLRDYAAASGHSGAESQGRGVAVMLNKPAPGISVKPTSIDFGQVPFDAELIAPVPVTIKSNGILPLALGSIRFNGPATQGFQLDRGNCPTGTLQPGASCTLQVSMSQSRSGYFNGYLGIASDATAEPIQIEVIGQVDEGPAGTSKLRLRVKSAKKVKAGKKLVVTAYVRNADEDRSGHFNLKAAAPRKQTGKIRFATMRNLSISGRRTSTFKFTVPVKRSAKGKFQVTVSLIAPDRKLVRKTARVKILKRTR